MTEVLLNSSEQTPQPYRYEGEFRPYVDQIQALLEVNDTDRTQIETHISGAAQTLAGLTSDQEKRVAIDAAANMLSWLLASPHDTPLPKGILAIVPDRHLPDDKPSDRLGVDFDPRVPYLSGDINLLYGRLLKAGASRSVDTYRHAMSVRASEMQSVTDAYLQESQAFRFVKSFEQEMPDINESRLDAYCRQVREAQIQDGVRKRFGMQSVDPFLQGTLPRQELGRRVFALDDETMPADNPENQTPLERLSAYLRGKALDYLEEANFTCHEIILEDDEDSPLGKAIYVRGTQGADSEVPSYNATLAIDEYMEGIVRWVMSDVLIDDRNPLSVVDYVYIEYLVHAALMPDVVTSCVSLQDFITKVTPEASRYAVRYMCALDHFEKSNYIPGDLLNALKIREPRDVEGPYAERDINALYKQINELTNYRYHDSVWSEYAYSSKPHAYSWEDQERLRNLTRGWVEWAPGNSSGVPLRLLEASNRLNDDVPYLTIDTDYDVAVTILAPGRYRAGRLDYNLFGYDLVAYRPRTVGEDTYYFKANPDGDPYGKCQVELPAAGHKALVNAYTEMGLAVPGHFADFDAVHTVQDLINAIRSVSEYAYTDDHAISIAYEDLQRKFNRLDSVGLKGYGTLILDGKLRLQCSGAGAFLSKSLNLVFGKDCTRVVSAGMVVRNGEDRIDGVGHAQTMLIHENRQYMLDATPMSYDPRDMTEFSWRQDPSMAHSQQVAGANLKPPKIDIQDEATELTKVLDALEPLEPTVIPQKSTDDKVDELIAGVSRWIQLQTGTRNRKDSFAALLGRSAHDPLRATAESLLATEAGNRPTLSPEKLREFLQSYGSAEGRVLREHGLIEYAPAVLEQLKAFIDNYIALRGE